MDKKLNNLQIKNEDFYFLYIERLSDKGVTDRLWHNHAFYEIMFVSEGKSEYVIENRRYTVNGGDVLLIRPYRHHFEHTRLETRSSLYCLGFSADAIANGTLAEAFFKKGEHLTVGQNSAFAELMNAARDKLGKSEDNAFPFIKSIAEAAVFALADCSATEENDAKIRDGIVGKVIEYVRANLSEIHTLEDISEHLFFSKSYIRDTFKKEMGIGIMEYVRNKKAVRAHELIRKGAKPTEIYTECGFSTYSSFYRAYLSYFGFSPKSKKK